MPPSGAVMLPEATARPARVPPVQLDLATDRTPGPIGDAPAGRGWWQAAAGCLLAAAGLLGLCRSRRRRE